MKLARLASALFLPILLAPLAAQAGPVDLSGQFQTSTLPANDDGSTGAVALGFAANYFGNTYLTTFVNNNGNVTFSSQQSTYTPSGLGSSYSGQPIIAPFFADVDTRGAGSGLTSYGTGTYAGNIAFGVTWPAVGYFGNHTDKLDTFQLVLVSRADTGVGDFDIYYNYNQIQWETGDASNGSGGLGGVSAAVGYNAGTGNAAGTFDQFAGSLVPGSFLDGGPDSLAAGTNDGVTGQYLFQVRDGMVTPVTPTPPVTPSPVPEPASLVLLGIGLLGLGIARRLSPA